MSPLLNRNSKNGMFLQLCIHKIHEVLVVPRDRLTFLIHTWGNPHKLIESNGTFFQNYFEAEYRLKMDCFCKLLSKKNCFSFNIPFIQLMCNCRRPSRKIGGYSFECNFHDAQTRRALKCRNQQFNMPTRFQVSKLKNSIDLIRTPAMNVHLTLYSTKRLQKI